MGVLDASWALFLTQNDPLFAPIFPLTYQIHIGINGASDGREF